MSRIQARPPVAPPRPGAPKIPNTAAAPVPAPVAATPAPAAPAAPAAEVQTITATDVGTVSPAELVDAVETAAPTATPKKRRGRQKSTEEKATYYGVLGWTQDAEGNAQAVMVDLGEGVFEQQRVKLTALPTDYDSHKHEKLKPQDFDSEALYYEFRAEESRKQMENFLAQAKKIRALGSTVDQKKASKVLKMRDQLEALKAQLIASGCDVAALLGEAAQ